MKTKSICAFFMMLSLTASLSARSARFSNSDFTLIINYTDEIYSGDAVIFNMTVFPCNKNVSLSDNEASITLFRDSTGKSPPLLSS